MDGGGPSNSSDDRPFFTIRNGATVVYSLNVPLPTPVRELTADLRPALAGLDRVRESRTQTLVLKRLPAQNRRDYLKVERRARAALQGAPAAEAEITGIDVFREPPNGPGPVCYLAVESPGLLDLHERLVEEFGAIEPLEGGEYAPHVTLGRGGSESTIRQLLERDIDPIRFTVTTLEFYDGTHGERIDTVSLPA